MKEKLPSKTPDIPRAPCPLRDRDELGKMDHPASGGSSPKAISVQWMEKAVSSKTRCREWLGSKDNRGPPFQLQKEPEVGIRDGGNSPESAF